MIVTGRLRIAAGPHIQFQSATPPHLRPHKNNRIER
jgi:hypothetical protein